MGAKEASFVAATKLQNRATLCSFIDRERLPYQNNGRTSTRLSKVQKNSNFVTEFGASSLDASLQGLHLQFHPPGFQALHFMTEARLPPPHR
jgi:hypothetical protein